MGKVIRITNDIEREISRQLGKEDIKREDIKDYLRRLIYSKSDDISTLREEINDIKSRLNGVEDTISSKRGY